MSDKKPLIAFFSASGKTAKLAKNLARATGGIQFRITPKVPYTPADLDWNDKSSRSTIEMNDPSSRPEIAVAVNNMDDYDVVFLGFPIWWYVAPSIIHTFLESYDFSGKTIIPFVTSGGSGLGETESILKKCCPDTTTWLPGKRFDSTADEDTMRSWVESLGL